MFRKLFGAALIGTATLLGVGTIRAYGAYKYYSGRCDANELNGIVIDSQHELIHQLIEKLKEKEAKES